MRKHNYPAKRKAREAPESRKFIQKHAATMTAKEMSIALGVSTQNIYDQLKVLGMKSKRKEVQPRRKPIDPNKQFILDKYDEYSIDDLARKTGFSVYRVQGILSAHGLVCTKHDDKTKYILKHYKTRSPRQMAASCKISLMTVYSIMRKFGLEAYVVQPVMAKGKKFTPRPQLTLKSFEGHLTIPVGYKKLSIVVPAGSSREFIETKKKKFLDRVLKAS